MGKKREHVLEKALAGDLDAIENILGQVYAPLFDLSYQAWGSVDLALPAVTEALELLARQLEAGALVRSSPFVVAAEGLLARLKKDLPDSLAAEAAVVAGLARDDGLALLARYALDLEGSELDEALALSPGTGLARAAAALGTLGLSEDELRDRLDEGSAAVALPQGLVDSVVSSFEDEDAEE